MLKLFQKENKVAVMGEAAEDVKREEEIVKVSLSHFRSWEVFIGRHRNSLP